VCKKSKTSIDRIVFLIAKGADVEQKTNEGKTALQYAKREIRQEVKVRFVHSSP
jgi:ankyrin repeat protein